MPNKPLHYCPKPGCRELVRSGYCEKHKIDDAEARGDRHERGYDSAWEKVRASKLRDNPLCESCKKQGHIKVASEVHHIKSIKKYPQLRLVKDNLMSVCHACHMRLERKP